MPRIDKSLANGMSDFFFVKADETDGTYDYYGYVDKDGVILIQQATKDLTTVLYWIGTGTFTDVWADKANKDYVTPDELDDPKVS